MALSQEWQLRVDRMKNTFRGLFGNKEAPRPKMCPACGNLVGISATRCPACGTSVNFSLAAAGRGVSGFFGGSAPATSVLLIVNILMFVVCLVSSLQRGEDLSLVGGMNGEVLFRLGGSSGLYNFQDHQWFRLITANFLHGSVLHIFLNMWILLSVGPILEELYGSSRYLFLYTVSGIAGYLLSSLHDYPSVGASAALLGLIGAMLAVTTKRGGDVIRAQRTNLIIWIVVIFAQGLVIPQLHIDNWAHFGGLIAGFVMGKLFADRQPVHGPEMKRAYALGWLAAAAIVLSFVLMILHVRDGIS